MSEVDQPIGTSPEKDAAGEGEKATTAVPPNLLLIIFIHGFKGDDTTFRSFPQRLQHILSETIKDTIVESVVFPAYETKGELTAAVIRFADWLTTLTVEREVANGLGGGAGKAKVVLCGHSMGGLLAADSLIEFVRTRADSRAPLWPNIVACLAFDTPYLGLHPGVFKNSITQVATHIRSAQEIFTTLQSFGTKKAATTSAASPKAAIAAAPTSPSSSGWGQWAPAAYALGGAMIAGAAAGTAYWRRDDIGAGYKWATDHMNYVGALWQEKELENRLGTLLNIESEIGVTFRTFYTFLPAKPPAQPESRMFVLLPKDASILAGHFIRAPNSVAEDEVQAHCSMFDSKKNDGYYDLGLATAQLVREAMERCRQGGVHVLNEGVGPAPVEASSG